MGFVGKIAKTTENPAIKYKSLKYNYLYLIAGFSVAFAIFPTKPMIARYLLLFCYSKILR